MIVDVTYAFQNAAIIGVGLTQFWLESRFTTFSITGNGSVSAGAVTIECCPGNAPMAATPTPGSGTVWTALTTITVPANATIKYQANNVVGSVRARISTSVTGGTVTVLAIRSEEQRGIPRVRVSTPVTGGTVTVLAIRPEEQKGWSRRPSRVLVAEEPETST